MFALGFKVKNNVRNSKMVFEDGTRHDIVIVTDYFPIDFAHQQSSTMIGQFVSYIICRAL